MVQTRKIVIAAHRRIEPDITLLFSDARKQLAQLLSEVPERYRDIAELRLEIKVEHLFGEEIIEDLNDIFCYAILFVEYVTDEPMKDPNDTKSAE